MVGNVEVKFEDDTTLDVSRQLVGRGSFGLNTSSIWWLLD